MKLNFEYTSTLDLSSYSIYFDGKMRKANLLLKYFLPNTCGNKINSRYLKTISLFIECFFWEDSRLWFSLLEDCVDFWCLWFFSSLVGILFVFLTRTFYTLGYIHAFRTDVLSAYIRLTHSAYIRLTPQHLRVSILTCLRLLTSVYFNKCVFFLT